jgi:hypothetical protein
MALPFSFSAITIMDCNVIKIQLTPNAAFLILPPQKGSPYQLKPPEPAVLAQAATNPAEAFVPMRFC